MLYRKTHVYIIGILLLYALLFNSCQHPGLNAGEDDIAQVAPPTQKPQAKQVVQVLTTPESPDAGLIMTSSSDVSPGTKQVSVASREIMTKRPPTRQPGEEASRTAAKRAKKEEELPGHKEWFTSFRQVVARLEENSSDEEAWEVWEDILFEGRKHNFLTKSIACPSDGNPDFEYEYTPLHYAAATGIRSIVLELVGYENIPVNIQTQNKKNTALHLASSRSHLDVVEYLLEQGADPNLLDYQGTTTLHYAAAGNYGEMARDIIHCLVKKGADFKKTISSGSSMLDTAVMQCNLPVIEYWEDVYEKNPDPDIDVMTKEALGFAKYRFKKHPEERSLQKDIIKILKKVMRSRQAKRQVGNVAK